MRIPSILVVFRMSSKGSAMIATTVGKGRSRQKQEAEYPAHCPRQMAAY